MKKHFTKTILKLIFVCGKIKNIINYIKSTDLIFEDSVYITNTNLKYKTDKVIDEHLLFITSCLNEVNIFDTIDFKDFEDYNIFLQHLIITFNNDNFNKSIHEHLVSILENKKHQDNIYVNFIKYLQDYYDNNYENHTTKDIYYVSTMLKEKDILIIQYKKNSVKRIIKNKLTNFDKKDRTH